LKIPMKEYGLVKALLIVLLVISFYDVVFLGKTFKVSTANSQAFYYGVHGQEHNKPKFIPINGTDSPVQEEPTYEFIKQNLRRGILPLWNPHQACGLPLIGIIETAMFFPLTFIMYLLPNLYAWDVLIFSRFLMAGLFTYWFMRTLRFPALIGLASAIIFMLSGPMVLLQYWTANVDILTPLLLISIEYLLKQPSRKTIAFVGFSVGMTFFAGHPEHIFFVNLYGFLYFCFRLFSLRRKVNTKKSFVYLGLAYLLGLGLASMVLWPFLRNLATEFWHGHPPGVGLHNEEIRSRILTLLVPFFFQKETLTYDFTFSGWWGGYLGTLPLWLACFGLFAKQKRGLNCFFWLLGFLIVSKAYSYFYINWIGYLPIFNLCRYAIHTPYLVAFTVAVAAGMGLRLILASKRIFSISWILSGLLILIVGFHVWKYKAAAHFAISREATLFFLFLISLFQLLLFLRKKNILRKPSFGFLIVLLIFFELFSYIHRERPRRFDSFPKIPYMEFLKSSPERRRAYGFFWTFYPNTASAYEADDLGIFFGLLPKRFVEFTNELVMPGNFKNDLRPPALRAMPITSGGPFLDMLNIQYIVMPSPERLSRLILNYDRLIKQPRAAVYAKEVTIFSRPSAFPRTYIVHKAIFHPNKDEAFNILRRHQLNLKEFVVINHRIAPQFLALNQTPVFDNSKARIANYTPNEVVVEVVMENPGFLVLSDAYHPDWKAYVNGQPTKVYLTNCLIRSVYLSKGHHVVRFKFEPLSFYAGTVISLLSLILILILAFSNKFSKKSY